MPNSSSSAAELPTMPILDLEGGAYRDGWMAVMAGIVAYWLSCLLVPPGPSVLGFGEQWQLMSTAPLSFLGLLPQRLLAPLLANAAGFGGVYYVLFARGLTILMLASVFFVARRFRGKPLDSLLVTLAVALTAPVQMYKLHWVGYSDPLCYTLLLWAMLVTRRPVLFWLLFGLNLLNHELAIFTLPWLWFLRRQVRGLWRTDAIGAGLAVGLYAAFYFYVKHYVAVNGLQQVYDASYFLQNPLFPSGTLVVWNLAIVQWTVAYGPMLAVVAWHQHARSQSTQRGHLWFLLLGIAVIFCIAFDWQRHTNLIVPLLVLASIRFLQGGNRIVFSGLLVATVLLSSWIPAWAPTSWPTHEKLVVPAFATKVVITSKHGYWFGGLGAFFGGWLPAVWPTLVSVFASLLAIWLVGFSLAWRRDRDAA